MKITHGPISDTFKKLLDEQAKLKEKQMESPSGEPMFDPDDIIATPHPLMKLLRGIFFVRKVTNESFSNRLRMYATNILGLLPVGVNSYRGNNLKLLKRQDEVTYRKFNEFLCGALGYTINDIEVTLISEEGEEMKFKVSDFTKSKEELSNMRK